MKNEKEELLEAVLSIMNERQNNNMRNEKEELLEVVLSKLNEIEENLSYVKSLYDLLIPNIPVKFRKLRFENKAGFFFKKPRGSKNWYEEFYTIEECDTVHLPEERKKSIENMKRYLASNELYQQLKKEAEENARKIEEALNEGRD